jgi:hypothetical protein
MFIEAMIPKSDSIFKFLRYFDADILLSKPQLKHLQSMAIQMLPESYKGKVSNFKHAHRSSISRFLNNSPWDDASLSDSLKNYVLNLIYNHSILNELPIFIMIDDTTCVKTKPSSQAKHTIESCSWHFSHAAGKPVYGHQFVTVMVRCGDFSFPYDVVCYQKENQSKIELAMKVLSEFPRPPHGGYVLADSWFTCNKILEHAWRHGFDYIGALKTNRIIFPKGERPKGIQIKEFAKRLDLKDLDLVTVGNNEYFVYTYEGRVKSGELAKIVLSWPKSAPLNTKALRCFISTNRNLSAKKILRKYLIRWEIETLFRESKQNFGFDSYQIHSMRGINRLMLIIRSLITFLMLKRTMTKTSLGEIIRDGQKDLKQKIVRFIRNQTLEGVSEKEIFETLKIA